LRHCHCVVVCMILLEFGALYDLSCCNVGFGAFLICCVVLEHGVTWTMLGNHEILAILVICDVG